MGKIATFYDHIKDISRQEGIPLIRAMERARELGVQLLEISQNNLIGREDEVGQELAYTGMGVSSIPSYFHFGRDLDVERQALPTLEAARYLGADKLLVIPGFFGEEDSPGEREEQVENMVQGVNRLAELAAGYGVSLVMEDYDSPLAPFGTIQGLRRFLDGCPALSCCFDTGNFAFAGQDEGEALGVLGDRIGHVHLKDRTFVNRDGTAWDQRVLPCSPVGEGAIRMEEMLEGLARLGYQGAYTLEFYGAPHTLEYLERSVAWVRGRLQRD